MSRFNSRKIALIGLKGEKGEPGDSGVLKGVGAPTTETIGEIGKFYVDTTSGTSYQCVEVDTETPSYTWVKVIKETDIAGNGKLGLVSMNANMGVSIDPVKHYLALQYASGTQLKEKPTVRSAVTVYNLDMAVKQALINPDPVGTNNMKADWTEEDRAKARETLGITSGGSGGGLFEHQFQFSVEGWEYTGYFYSTTSDLVVKAEDSLLTIGILATGTNLGRFNSTIVGVPIVCDGNQFFQADFDRDYCYFKYQASGQIENLTEVVL